MVKVHLQVLTCKRCGHKWVPRKEEVRICPRCCSQYWNQERKKMSKGNDGINFLQEVRKRRDSSLK